MNLIHVNGMPMPETKGKWQIGYTQLKYLLAMKLFVIILTLSLNVSANAYSQKIDLSISNGSLREAMQQVRKQTGYNFFFKSDILKNARPVNVTLKQVSIEEALQAIFKDQPFNYEIKDNGILLKSKPTKSVIDKVMDFYSAITIRGKVVDENGAPLLGASVKAGSKTAIADANGEFSLTGVEEGATIEISYLGYKTALLVASGQFMSVQLVATPGQLNETIIKGYYTTTKKLNTGNVVTIKGSIIVNQPVTNPLQGLAGRVAGLQIIENNGLPGSPITVQIRGRNSINGKNNPLYIIDGVPFSATPIEIIGSPASGVADVGSPLNNINPSDIESVQILKDADATAIYGSRGSNGVILITTKRGSVGESGIDANYNRGYGSVTNTPPLFDTQQFLQFRKDAFTNAGVTPTAANAPELFSYDQNASFDWLKWYMGNTATRQNASLTFKGGNAQTTFLANGTYHDERSVKSKNDIYRRVNFHLNGGHRSEDGKFSINADVFYSGSYNRLTAGTAIAGIITAAPNYPVFDDSGEFNWPNTNNYVAMATAYNKSSIDNLICNLGLNYTFSNNLAFKLNTGYSTINVDQKGINPIASQYPAFQPTGISLFGNQNKNSLIVEPQLNFQKEILNGKLEALVGGTYQNDKTRGKSLTIAGYTNDKQLESINFGTIINRGDNIIDYKYASVFGRLNYNYGDKYILNATFRRDGSSRFGAGEQFGNFGSIGAAWVFSNESFIQNRLNWLTYGKLRGSYGSTGNDGIPDYGYLSLYTPGSLYGNANTLVPSQIANENYSWEINKKLEVALELGILKNRISLNTAYYRNRSNSQLVGYPLASTTGFPSYQANLPALVQNKGWEFELNTTNVDKGGFVWATSGNLTISQNKLVNFPGLEQSTYAGMYVAGQSLNIVQGFHSLGVDPITGLPSTEDLNKDGNFTRSSSYNGQGGDYIIMGTTDPKWFAGLNNSFTYKGIELNVFFQFVKQRGYNLLSQASFFGRSNIYAVFLDYWKQSGDQTPTPKPLSSSNINLRNYGVSDATFSDASFLRLKNISLSYSLPHSLAKIGLRNCKIYFLAQNILTVTKYKGYDPELAGNPNLLIPPLKVYSFGIQASL
jgi:TonB-linked SusC/RagA family outer membrane protein